MKTHFIRLSAILAALIISITLFAPSDPCGAGTVCAQETDRKNRISLLKSKKKTYYILAVGNSLNYESVHYLRKAAKKAGYKVVVGLFYSSGSSVKQHDAFCSGLRPGSMRYREYTAAGISDWTYPTFKQVLGDHPWHAVLLQTTVKRWNTLFLDKKGDSYLTHMSDLIHRYYKKRGRKAPAIGLNLIWSRRDGYTGEKTFVNRWKKSSLAMYTETMTQWKKVVEQTDGIDFYVCTGTAVQNARTTYLKPALNRDGKHVNYGYGRFLAALCVLRSLGVDPGQVTPIKYEKRAGRTSRAHLKLLRKCVETAAAQPFAVTDLSGQYSKAPVLDPVKVKTVKKIRKSHAVYTVTWTRSRYATGYKVYYKAGNVSGWKLCRICRPSAKRKAVIKKKNPNKQYRFKVVALGDMHIRNAAAGQAP